MVPGSRFCGRCGHPVSGPVPVTYTAHVQQMTSQSPPHTVETEQIMGIIPFIEQGLISVIHYTLIVTDRRLIFCTWNPDNDEPMSEADDDMTEESCNISETTDEISHFRAKDWASGPWQRYRALPIDSIAANAPGSITIPVSGIVSVTIVCETSSSTQDTLSVEERGRQHTFDLMYSQGPFLYDILRPLLGERVEIEDHLHRRGKLDRLLTGQEYK